MNSTKIYDVIILGTGPAGLTAAVYCGRAGLSVLLLDKDTPGGKLIKTYEVENYPPFINIKGVDLGSQMFEQALQFGNEFESGDVIDLKRQDKHIEVICTDQTFQAISVIVATGTRERKLYVPGEDKYFSHGVSTCAVCDGALYKDKVMVVIGGGYSATEEGLYLTRFAKKIYLVHRRQEFRVPKNIVEDVKSHTKIELILDSVATEILGDGKIANGIKIKNLKTNKVMQIDTSVIFPYIGQIPNTDFAKKLGILNADGFLLVNDLSSFATKCAGIYGAGDVLDKNLRQIANAVGDGANCGQAVIKYVDIQKKCMT